MPDVIEQLRAYGEAAEAAVACANPAPAAAPEARRSPLLAAAAVLVLVVSAAVAVWVLRSRDEGGGEGPTTRTVEPTPGWQWLPPGLLPRRLDSALVWTGEELVVWGGSLEPTDPEAERAGAAFDPDTQEWRPMSPAPIAVGPATAVWTGVEVLITAGFPGETAAWNPDTDRWRRLADRLDVDNPIHRGGTVWTGEALVDTSFGLVYDLTADAWRPMPAIPGGGQIMAAAWTGEAVVVILGVGPLDEAAAAAYDPETDAWTTLPDPGIGQVGVSLAWDGERIVAVDQELRVSTYRPGDSAWEPIASLPLRTAECPPELYVIGASVLAHHCSGEAQLRPDDTWSIGPPTVTPGRLTRVPADDRMFLWWTSDRPEDIRDHPVAYFQQQLLEPLGDDLALDPRIPVGTVLLDLPPEASLARTEVTRNGAVTRLRFELDGVDCDLESTYGWSVGSSEARIRSEVEGVTAELGQVHLAGVGGDPSLVARVEAGELDEQAHVLLEETTGDVLDIACSDLATAEDLLARIHR
jgi:hypothetical protein